MSTIAAFEKEIKLQVRFVQNFVSQRQLSIPKQKQTIFCGTGDSFVSAQLAEVFSGFRARACDPLDLLKNKRLAKDKDLYMISISGNTVSNIKLAKAVKNTVAVTAYKQSRLVNACKKLILLQYPNSGIFTAGSISFLASALTCISLVSKIKIRNVSKLYKKADTQSRKIRLRGKVFLLGNMHTFPVAMFGAAKIYEAAGLDAHYERIEQFSHMGLFQKISIKNYGTIVARGLLVIAQWMFFYLALIQGSTGVVMTLSNTAPIFVFLLSFLFLREKPTLKKLICASLVLALSIIISFPPSFLFQK
jgi:glucosamine 6-phosphate synthetase-like amidotransferase/phosphosugar isomerase protein